MLLLFAKLQLVIEVFPQQNQTVERESAALHDGSLISSGADSGTTFYSLRYTAVPQLPRHLDALPPLDTGYNLHSGSPFVFVLATETLQRKHVPLFTCSVPLR